MTAARCVHAQLHLLDRQVVRAGDGRLLCKVDELELLPGPDGRPYVASILAGPLALGPRLGGVPGRLTVAVTELFRPEERPGPRRIPMALVSEIGSAIRIGGETGDLALERWVRDHVIAPIPGSGETGAPERAAWPPPGESAADARRLSALLGRRVVDAAGEPAGRVADVRLSQDGPMLGEVQRAFRVEGLIVVPRRAGRLFGYERGPGGKAPWLVNRLIRWLNRGGRFATWEQIASLGDPERGDGDGEPVRLAVPAGELAPLDELYERAPG
ncbi:hypothetical protein ACFYSC_16130 [Streptosporangium sp. NPDC004379]|uniref:hypothetical protein n=1 Tax=Streptosporangium sp. NPDC004379 TaxID=3366189 RepID=UPI0036872AB6